MRACASYYNIRFAVYTREKIAKKLRILGFKKIFKKIKKKLKKCENLVDKGISFVVLYTSCPRESGGTRLKPRKSRLKIE